MRGVFTARWFHVTADIGCKYSEPPLLCRCATGHQGNVNLSLNTFPSVDHNSLPYLMSDVFK